MKKLFCLLLIITGTNMLYGQVQGSIKGSVADQADRHFIDYATIVVTDARTKKIVTGGTTDSSGKFMVRDIAYGIYTVQVESIGYKNDTINEVTLSADQPEVTLKQVLLLTSQHSLQGVTVIAKTATVENKIDKMVYNPANDIAAQSGTALDILKKVPQLSVDIDGNVELQGNSNIRFLINGKPSSMFGANLADALQTIPATQIKNIEVITSPGAKYDASGTGGIINIVLKDNKVQGTNGTVNLSAGTRQENGSFNLNIRKSKFGINAFISGNGQVNTTTVNTNDRTSTSGSEVTQLHQNGNSDFTRQGYQAGIGADWDITKRDLLNASLGFNYFGNGNKGTASQDQNVSDAAAGYNQTDSLLRTSDSRYANNTFDYSINYRKTFNRENHELNVLATSSYGRNNSFYSQRQDYIDPSGTATGSRSNNPGTDRETNISADYTQPVTKTFTIETGIKAIFEHIDNNVSADTLLNGNVYQPDGGQSYSFRYDRDIYCAYLSASFSLFHDFITGKAGLRDEYTTVSAAFPGTKIPDYNILAPSFTLMHKFNKTQSIKFAFTYRIERPDYGDLNPFLNISDPHNITTGNPQLKPEIGHNFEMGYNKSSDKGNNLYIAAFYRYNTDDIQGYTNFYPEFTANGTTYSNVFVTQRQNIGREVNTGLNVNGSLAVSGKLNLRSNIMLSDKVTSNPGSTTVSGFAYRINLNCSYQFGHDFVGELFGNYNSSQRRLQGMRPAYQFYTIAFRKQLLDRKLSIGLSATNPFNKYVNQTTTTVSDYFRQTSLRQVPYQSFAVNLVYKFGGLEFKKGHDKEDSNLPTPIDN